MSGKEVLPVGFGASWGSAPHVLGAWREAKGNQSEVNYNHLPSNSSLYALELLYSMDMLNIQFSEMASSSTNCINNEENIQPALCNPN